MFFFRSIVLLFDACFAAIKKGSLPLAESLNEKIYYRL
ncbi:hypothetical protein NIASO_08685 [Niabella soli DSM 19437]|uniref:Uncharacterized protein n=1 Tax=Niabella soli DSM 19437 TaxID=929713 RepID=W0F6N6_9BACT|nr:hypothetical protein NIASO_08685 [Niabella soli DSM 19437]